MIIIKNNSIMRKRKKCVCKTNVKEKDQSVLQEGLQNSPACVCPYAVRPQREARELRSGESESTFLAFGGSVPMIFQH